MRVTVLVALWNAQTFLPSFLEGLQKQTVQDFSLIVFDNGPSVDVETVKRVYPQAQVLGDGTNQGFAKAFNAMIREAQTPYVLVINQDIILEATCLERLLQAASHHPQASSLVPTLYKARFEGSSIIKTNLIDTTGLQMYRSRHVQERGSGRPNKPWESGCVFGGSGACVLYTKEALQAVAYQGEYFDESFIAYKEDIDLAYRLQWEGYESWFESSAVGWHFRGLSAPLQEGFLAQREERKKRKEVLRRYSYANHFRFLIKNEDIHAFGKDVVFVLWYEMRKFFFLLVTEPKTLLGMVDVIRAFPDLWRKRKKVMANRKKKWQDIRMFIQS